MADSGWYPDPADETLERYWDGAAWSASTRPRTPEPYQVPAPTDVTGEESGEPSGYAPAPGAGTPAPPPGWTPAPPPGYGATAQPGTGYGPPGAHPGAPGGYAPAGYPPVPPPVGAAWAPMNTTWGKRALALLLDGLITVAPVIVISVLLVVVAALSDADGDGSALLAVATFLWFASFLWVFGFSLYNTVFLQGRSGQTIGKRYLKIRLVRDADGQPLGAGMAFVRWLVAAGINSVCGIIGIVDYLFPLWEPNRKRLVDKWLNFSVIDA